MSASYGWQVRRDRIVAAAADLLTEPGNVNHAIRRWALAEHLTKFGHVVWSDTITRCWPAVEARVVQISAEREEPLFAVRPMAQWGYRCAVTTDPTAAILAQVKREQHVASRLRNDRTGGATEHLLAVAPLDPMDRDNLVMLRARRDAFLASWEAGQVDRDAAWTRLTHRMLTMPDIVV